jgi:membrane protein
MPIEHEGDRRTLQAKRERRGAPDSEAPDSPVDLDSTTKKATIKRTLKEFSADQLTDSAAALTYYAVLALFPALIALVSVVGLLGSSVTTSLLDNVKKLSPGPGQAILTNAINGIAGSGGAAGLAFVIGLVLALNAASGYIAAFSRASNQIYDVEEGRPVYKLKPQQIGITLVLLLSLIVIAAGVTVSGPLATSVGQVVGLGDTGARIFDIAKIPVILLLVSFMIAFLYWAAPNVKQPKFAFISPGGVVALVLFIVASLLFSLYVAGFSSYNKTYGSLGGVIAFLVWLWITNIAVLFGAEFNAELQRSQQREAGFAAPLDEPFLEPRDASKQEKNDAKE